MPPLSMLSSSCPAKLFLSECENIPSHVSICDVLQYAIYLDDTDLLSFLFDLCPSVTDGNTGKIDFNMAIKLGSLGCLSLIIRRTAAGLPLDKLADTYGVAAVEKPKYYQGLSIRGKKRSDWATAGVEDGEYFQRRRNGSPPLLVSAKEGSLSSIEWFLSTAPERQYMEFADTHKDDKRVRRLSLAEQGIQRCITNWLQLRGKS